MVLSHRVEAAGERPGAGRRIVKFASVGLQGGAADDKYLTIGQESFDIVRSLLLRAPVNDQVPVAGS